MKRLILALILAAAVLPAFAANSITFTAANTTGNGSVVPVLTWSTSPAASGCVASGDWTGSKGPSGTLTLPAITASATYNLQCNWPAQTTATIGWSSATQNTDGSVYSDAKLTRIYYGTSLVTLTLTKDVLVPAVQGVITPLSAGTWFFTLASVNQNNIESAKTAPVSLTLAGSSDQKNLGITVNPIPNPPTNVTATAGP